jgi:uncharacterized protein
MKSAQRNKKFEEGLAHFNAKKFFEAHEFWEEIWLVETEPEKTFLQGLIQITAAFHHYQSGNPEGAESLLAAGIVKLLRFPKDHRGLAIGALRENAKQWARALGMGDDLGGIGAAETQAHAAIRATSQRPKEKERIPPN